MSGKLSSLERNNLSAGFKQSCTVAYRAKCPYHWHISWLVTAGLPIHQILYTLLLFMIKWQTYDSLYFPCIAAGAIPKLGTLQISHNRLSTADDLKHLAECHHLRYSMCNLYDCLFVTLCFQKISILTPPWARLFGLALGGLICDPLLLLLRYFAHTVSFS